MSQLTQKEACCGCGACAQVCVKNCITMKADEEGFRYPSVDMQQCVNCGLCERVCPILNKPETEAPSQVSAYAAYTNEEAIREASSSGGIFTLLAEAVLSRQGVVFGAAFDEKFDVHHVMVDRLEDLWRLRGSKYVQSRIGDTYRQAKEQLESGRPVLFSGVACQIAGLKNFLGKNYSKLYTVDVLCHGVPSPRAWNKYKQAQETAVDSEIQSIFFRSKVAGWKKFSMVLEFQNGGQYCELLSEDAFMKWFLRDICLRPSCHSCRFKSLPYPADITLGDAWGIDRLMPDMDDDRGTSVVLVNTEKGSTLWAKIQDRMVVRQGDVEQLLAPNGAAKKSVKAHPKRKAFFTAMNNGATADQLTRMVRVPLVRRVLSFGKRCVKKILKI
ncbi:MAG: Coenzyme F420 hydrogenase/dehydrogenase, beta subunit C-terminal domain [Oscillospiraceae bacterium]|nr:Coenzyme F420 hydrogenase/dehydrogenase, beta subunit C-terminal domain [Oscillospiraceae bacterium]